jgi:hypothetical protein
MTAQEQEMILWNPVSLDKTGFQCWRVDLELFDPDADQA